VSGESIMMTSAHAAASAIDCTFTPDASAFAADLLPARKPTRTSTPLSFRLSVCACPCEP
jgi:hypothetical protein